MCICIHIIYIYVHIYIYSYIYEKKIYIHMTYNRNLIVKYIICRATPPRLRSIPMCTEPFLFGLALVLPMIGFASGRERRAY